MVFILFLFPIVDLLVFATIAAFSLLWLVDHPTQINSRGKDRTNLDGVLHSEDKYENKLK
jgi:hypothetical protein